MKNFILKLLKESIIVAIGSLLGTFTGIGVGTMLAGKASPWFLITPIIMVLFNIVMRIFPELRSKIEARRKQDE